MTQPVIRNLPELDPDDPNSVANFNRKINQLSEALYVFWHQFKDINITPVTGTPESQLVGSIGDLALRTDGGANTTLYVKQSGSETNTGWIAK